MMMTLREVAQSQTREPILAAALYRTSDPFNVRSGPPLAVAGEIAMRSVARRAKHPPSHVLLALSKDRLFVFSVKSKLTAGWVIDQKLSDFAREALASQPLKGEPYGLEIVLPGDAGVLRLYPAYMTPESADMARELVGTVQ